MFFKAEEHTIRQEEGEDETSLSWITKRCEITFLTLFREPANSKNSILDAGVTRLRWVHCWEQNKKKRGVVYRREFLTHLILPAVLGGHLGNQNPVRSTSQSTHQGQVAKIKHTDRQNTMWKIKKQVINVSILTMNFKCILTHSASP